MNKNIYWTAALGTLVFALLSAFHNSRPMMVFQDTNWYFNYDLGYNHRGLMGSIFQFFHGVPKHDVIHSTVPAWDYTALAIIIIASWLLLTVPIARMRVNPSTRWLLLSFAAMLLLAPIWRQLTFLVGFMDKFIFIVVLAAMFAFVMQRWLLYVLFSVAGFLIHPMMIFYQLLFVVLIAHALLTLPQYRERAAVWIGAVLFPFLLSLILYFVNTPEYNIASLETYNYPDKAILEQARADFLSPGVNNRNAIFGKFLMFPMQYVVLVILFSIIPLLLAFLFTHAAQSNNLFVRQYSNSMPVIGKLAPLLRRTDIVLLFAAAIFVFYPVHFVAIDIQRQLYWSQWGMLLVYIYLLWTSPAPVQEKKQEKKKQKKKGKSPLDKQTRFATAFFFALAYTFGGAPLVEIPTGLPLIFKCEKFCIPLLTTNNPLGELYSKGVYAAVKGTLLPMRIDGNAIRLHDYVKIKDLEIIGGALRVPADKTGYIFHSPVSLEKGEKVKLRLAYRSDGGNEAPPLHVHIFGQNLEPVRSSGSEAVWELTATTTAHWPFQIHTAGGVAFDIQEFSIEGDG